MEALQAAAKGKYFKGTDFCQSQQDIQKIFGPEFLKLSPQTSQPDQKILNGMQARPVFANSAGWQRGQKTRRKDRGGRLRFLQSQEKVRRENGATSEGARRGDQAEEALGSGAPTGKPED